MKKKKIKDLAKKLVKFGREYDRKRYNEEPVALKEDSSDLNYCEYDEKVSQKFSKFVLNLIKLKDKISINLYEYGFDIFCDLNKFKNGSKNYSENTFDIRIDKIGFKIRRNYSNWTAYKDSEIFNSLKEQIVEKNKIVSKELLFETVDELTVELNLSRENNLDEILK
jgi:hypothetical protein